MDNASLSRKIEEILANDFLDDEASDTKEEGVYKCDEIEKMIEPYGWEAVEDHMIDILYDRNGELRFCDYLTAAEVLWGAVLDKRNIKTNTVIALLVYRFYRPEVDDFHENLAWSIIHNLKKRSYTSSYQPEADEEVLLEKDRLGITFAGKYVKS